MVDPRMYEGEHFVLLIPNQPEQFLTAAEMLERLKGVLETQQADLPRDLQRFSSLQEQAQYLMETSCELDVGAGEFFQWYAVRLEK